MSKKSNRNNSNQILGVISPRQAESLLLDWVNLPNPTDYPPHRGAVEKLLSRYSYIFAFRKTDRSEGGRQTRTTAVEALLAAVQIGLRRAWLASDDHQRDWYLFQLRYAYERTRARIEDGIFATQDVGDTSELRARRSFRLMIEELLQHVPEATPFEAAVFHLQTRLAHRMRCCPNPDCAKPYFFRMKKGQKYCSAACADPARREAKRIWWNQNRGKGARP
jgi:hypothetical protein